MPRKRGQDEPNIETNADDQRGNPYNPLEYRNLGLSVASTLLEQLVIPLTELEPFNGSGIYAVYYTGTFPAYERLVLANRDGFHQPIYIGKAVTRGSRTGGWVTGLHGTSLYDRLNEHRESVEQASNLSASAFSCQYLVVDDVWISLGEAVLIDRFTPVWNKVIDGFGIHDPGKGRRNQRRSKWDTLHPGRPFAADRPDNRHTADELTQQAHQYLQGILPPLLSEAEQAAEAWSDEEKDETD